MSPIGHSNRTVTVRERPTHVPDRTFQQNRDRKGAAFGTVT